jgi:hypothetical protein
MQKEHIGWFTVAGFCAGIITILLFHPLSNSRQTMAFSHDLLLEISFIFHLWTKLQSLVTWKLIGYVCRDAAFCLICGDLLCFNSKCCYRGAEECSRHADEGGVSRLIMLSVE